MPLPALLLSAFAACAPPPPAPQPPAAVQHQGDYRVSVTSAGQSVRNFEQQLVHWIDVPRRSVDLVLASWPKKLNLPFEFAVERDTRGGIRGLRVVRDTQYDLPRFGLQPGDIVTAVETTSTTKLADLQVLFEALKRNAKATMTFERNATPHKTLFRLVP